MAQRALVVTFIGDTAQLDAAVKRSLATYNSFGTAIERSGARWTAAGRGMQSFGRQMAPVSLGLAAIGGYAIKSASDFQSSSEKLRTQAGATQAQVEKLRAGMLGLARVLPQSPQELTAGMYHIVSSMNAVLPPTQRVTGELKMLKVSAQLAAVGGSSLEETSYALASAMNALHAPISQTSKVAGELNAIVGSGDMTMTDFLDAIKSGLIPTARSFGVSLQSVGSALAVMGDMGMRGSLAGTRLRMALSLIGAPSSKAAGLLQTVGLSARQATADTSRMSDLLAKAGLNTTQLAADLKHPNGLSFALQDLNTHLEKSGLTAQGAAALISSAFGGGKMGAAIKLLDENTGRLSTKFDQIGKTAGNFGGSVTAASHTASWQWHTMLSSMQADAIELGTTLMPVAVTIAGDITHLVDAFAHLPAPVKDAVEALAAVAVVAAPIAMVVGTIARAYGGVLTVVGKIAPATAEATAATAGSTASVGTAARDMAASVRAATQQMAAAMEEMAVASRTSALQIDEAFASEASSATSAARVTMTAAAEMRGASSLPVPMRGAAPVAPLAAAAPVAESATVAEATLVSRLRTGVATALSGVFKGGLIAGFGTMLAQTVGSAIHGGVGHAVSSIGTDTAIGAGIGSIFGMPIPGAVLGGLVGGVTSFIHNDAAKQGDEFAKQFTSTFAGHLTTAVQNAQHHLAAAGTKAAPQLNKPGTPLAAQGINQPRFETNPGQRLSSAAQGFVSQKEIKQNIAAAQTWGKASGQAFATGWKQVKIPTTTVFLADARHALNDVPAQVRKAGSVAVQAWRESAAKQMIAYATSLQQNGKLPMKGLQQIVRSLESQIPGLSTYLVQNGGVKTARGLADAFRFTQASANLRKALSSYRQQFGDWEVSSKLTGQNIWQNASTAMDHLHHVVRTSTGQAKQDALANIRELQQQSATLLSKMAANSKDRMAELAASAQTGTASAARSVWKNFSNIQTNVDKAMQSGTTSAKQGAKIIAQELNAALHAFGAAPIPIPALTAAWKAPSSINAPSTGALTPGQHATGGVVTRPTFIVGEEAPQHPEVVLATNPAYRSRNLGLWAKAGKMLGVPGYAVGGVVTASDYSGGTTASGANADSTVGYAELSNPPSSLNFSALGHLPMGYRLRITYNGKSIVAPKIDVGAGGAGLNGHIRAVDLTMPAANLLGFNGLADVLIAAANGQPLSIGGASGSAPASQIKPPNVKGGGTLGTIVRAAMGKLTAAANAKLAKLAPKASAFGGGVGGGTPFHHGRYTFPLPAGSWTAGAVDQGWDLSAAAHTPEFAIAPGTVVGHGIGGFGPWAPIIKLDDGNTVYYGHAGPGGEKPVGTRVKAGEVIGEVGAGIVGISTGPHLEIGFYPPGGMGAGAAMKSALGYRKGGIPFAGSFDGGGVVPGPLGQPAIALVHGGEMVWPPYTGWGSGSGGSGLTPTQQLARITPDAPMTMPPGLFGGVSGAWGWTPTLSQHFRELEHTATRAGSEIAKLTKQLKDAHGAQKTALEDQLKAAKKEQAAAQKGIGKVMTQLAVVPSQSTGRQIKMTELQNRVAIAQNAGNVGGQKKGFNAELRLEQSWLKDDQKRLRQINRALRTRGLSKKQRAGLLQDKLAMLQEIGTIEGDIGSTQQSLTDLATSSDTSSTDSGGTDTTLVDAINTLNQTLQDQLHYMQQVGDVEKQTAIKALADVISGEIGGNYLSRSTGSAGIGTVVRY